MSAPGNGESFSLRNVEIIEYDTENGELKTIHEALDMAVTEVIKVRQQLMEKALRQAVIFELEKLGYTVLLPENGDR